MTGSRPPADDRPYSRQEVIDILQAAVSRVSRDDDQGLHAQLRDLARYMEGLRHELAQLRSIEISHTHIPDANDELDAVINETAAATSTIMDACERLQAQEMTGASPALQAAINTETTAIFEACSFQDITGQRITKVIRALKNIEQKVGDILTALGHAGKAADKAMAAHEDTRSGDAALLNGPQLSGKAISQDDIDKLLASFD